MRHMNRLAGGAVLAFTLLALPQQAGAVMVLGEQLFSTGGDVEVEVLPASAGFTSELHLFSPGPDIFIALNSEVGKIVDLGSFPIGEELLFGIFVRNTGHTFYMGPGSRNPDGIEHAGVDFLGPGLANVGFEDLFGGGDRDYDDNVFQFRGGIAPTPQTPVVPEPGSLMLMSLGMGAVGFRRWRKTS